MYEFKIELTNNGFKIIDLKYNELDVNITSEDIFEICDDVINTPDIYYCSPYRFVEELIWVVPYRYIIKDLNIHNCENFKEYVNWIIPIAYNFYMDRFVVMRKKLLKEIIERFKDYE